MRDEKGADSFCWFADREAETIVNGLYLAAILSQHTEQWHLLLGNIDPIYGPLRISMKQYLRMMFLVGGHRYWTGGTGSE